MKASSVNNNKQLLFLSSSSLRGDGSVSKDERSGMHVRPTAADLAGRTHSSLRGQQASGEGSPGEVLLLMPLLQQVALRRLVKESKWEHCFVGLSKPLVSPQ